MQTITDDVSVFRFLERSGHAFFDPGKSAALEFRTEEFLAVLLFHPSGPLKGCRLYLLEISTADQEMESVLLPELLALPEEHGYFSVKNEALAIAEKLISRRNGGRLFFDAH